MNFERTARSNVLAKAFYLAHFLQTFLYLGICEARQRFWRENAAASSGVNRSTVQSELQRYLGTSLACAVAPYL